jgi:hypothetical protein
VYLCIPQTRKRGGGDSSLKGLEKGREERKKDCKNLLWKWKEIRTFAAASKRRRMFLKRVKRRLRGKEKESGKRRKKPPKNKKNIFWK